MFNSRLSSFANDFDGAELHVTAGQPSLAEHIPPQELVAVGSRAIIVSTVVSKRATVALGLIVLAIITGLCIGLGSMTRHEDRALAVLVTIFQLVQVLNIFLEHW